MGKLLPRLHHYLLKVEEDYPYLSAEKKSTLGSLANLVNNTLDAAPTASMIFVSQHNARRSILSEVWAHVAAYYYGISEVTAYSAGLAPTSFYPEIIKVLLDCGFEIDQDSIGPNPFYKVWYAPSAKPLRIFAKPVDSPENPGNHVITVANCAVDDHSEDILSDRPPLFPLHYPDISTAHSQEQEAVLCRDLCHEIANDMAYLFSLCQVKAKVLTREKV